MSCHVRMPVDRCSTFDRQVHAWVRWTTASPKCFIERPLLKCQLLVRYMGSQEDDLKMLNKDFSCGGLDLQNPRFLGGGWCRSIYHPQDVCHIWNRLMCWDVSNFEPSKLDKPSTVAGVQGEVYQADLLGIGTVAVKISRRNDDYAKGDLGGKIWKLWRSLTLTLLIRIPHSKWLDSNVFFLMACKFSLVALLDDAISLFLINDETELAHHFRSLKCKHFNSERAFPLQKPRWSICWMTHWSMLTANMNCQVCTLFHTLAMYIRHYHRYCVLLAGLFTVGSAFVSSV